MDIDLGFCFVSVCRSSHHTHHSFHNDVVRDKTWTPITKSHYRTWCEDKLGVVYKAFRFSPLMFLLFPYYLLSPFESNLNYGSHFNPSNKSIFLTKEDSTKGAIGTGSIVLWLAVLFKYAYSSSSTPISSLVDWYFVPYMIFTCWLSFVTYMHHMAPESVFMRSVEKNKETGEWSFAKGAETTIDRDFGPILNYLHHNIETHFVHHLFFTKIPHYNLVKATEAVKAVAGDKYK